MPNKYQHPLQFCAPVPACSGHPGSVLAAAPHAYVENTDRFNSCRQYFWHFFQNGISAGESAWHVHVGPVCLLLLLSSKSACSHSWFSLCQCLIDNSNCVCLLIKQSQQKSLYLSVVSGWKEVNFNILSGQKENLDWSDIQRCKFITSWLDEWNVLHLTPLIKSYSDTEVDGWGVPNVKINGEPWK